MRMLHTLHHIFPSEPEMVLKSLVHVKVTTNGIQLADAVITEGLGALMSYMAFFVHKCVF